MPFVSEAQKRKLAQLVKEGTLPQSTFDEFARATPPGKLPERAPRTGKIQEIGTIKIIGGKARKKS